MSTLVALIFNDESTGFEMRAAVARMQKQYRLDMEDAVVVTRDAKGKTKLHQAVSLTTHGAVGGEFWGMLLGLLFLNPPLGAAAGRGKVFQTSLNKDYENALREVLEKPATGAAA